MKKKGIQKRDHPKRAYMSQEAFPQLSLENALKIAKAISDNYAGKGAAPDEIALALKESPTSSKWRFLCGASIAYGLTKGGCNAPQINITQLGNRIVAPTEEGDDLVVAKIEAILRPKIMNNFYKKYDKAKYPKEEIVENVLVTLGIPRERAKASAQIIRENGVYTGILKSTRTGLYLTLGSPAPPPPPSMEKTEEPESVGEDLTHVGEEITRVPEAKIEKSNSVFISHGKNKAIVNQLKELLIFGKFKPIVSTEQETTSISVHEKVFDDMRRCSAAVIHVSSEGTWNDSEGNTHIKINDNVLIEIGAAMALYVKNFVLLVQKGVELPSNLQGLYRCDYEGEKLDYDATMKLLKTFNEFK